MNKENLNSDRKRMNRLVSEIKAQPIELASEDKKTTVRRRVSCDELKTVKRTN
jgi:hypothetical protein